MTAGLVHALHSLAEDAKFAYHRALDGDDTGLEALGRAMKLVETEVQTADAEKRLQMRRTK